MADATCVQCARLANCWDPARTDPSLVLDCAQGLTDQHPKVRWAACQALGQMCTDLGPDLQTSQHARILPGLMAIMDDFSQPRVQVTATACDTPDSAFAAHGVSFAPVMTFAMYQTGSSS